MNIRDTKSAYEFILTASQRGTFDFTCGIHGAASQSKGTINIK